MQNFNNIRFTKLNIKLRFAENSILPSYKVSALRGGLGQALLDQNCVNPSCQKNCEDCPFSDECIVRKIMYSRYKIKPSFVTGNESGGFDIDCLNYNREFSADDELRFNITLYGNMAAYITPILYALATFGEKGLGDKKSKFYVSEVTNRKGGYILGNQGVDVSKVYIETLEDYVNERMSYNKTNQIKMIFKTPCTVKYESNEIVEFSPEPIFVAIARKITMLNYYMGNELEYSVKDAILPIMVSQHSKSKSVPRYSSTQDKHMYLNGIIGEMILDNVSEEMLRLAYASEIVHIGKNTRLGCGCVRIEQLG